MIMKNNSKLRELYENLPKPTSPKTVWVHECAKFVGVSTATVRGWVMGRSKPQQEVHLELLSQFTGIPKDEIFSEQN